MNAPFLSVVIRSKDEADRLRLTLASLECQIVDSEVVVVDDGSSDHTAAILAEAANRLPLTVVRHAQAKGRAAASTAGAATAQGDVLLFLDGDTLAGPDLLAHHAALHAGARQVVARGEIRHLRCTRMFRDPDRGTPWPSCVEATARLRPEELDRMRVRLEQVRTDFGAIERRSQPGVYPGSGPRQLSDLEFDALLNHAECPVLWAAASGSNMSVRRDDFLRAGGFNERIDINEHRELALRLTQRGCRMAPLSAGKSYHLIHRSGWRNPLTDTAWEAEFLRVHMLPAVALLAVLWASLPPDSSVPEGFRIKSLPDLASAACGDRGLDYDVARRSLNLAPLGTQFWFESGQASSFLPHTSSH